MTDEEDDIERLLTIHRYRKSAGRFYTRTSLRPPRAASAQRPTQRVSPTKTSWSQWCQCTTPELETLWIAGAMQCKKCQVPVRPGIELGSMSHA